MKLLHRGHDKVVALLVTQWLYREASGFREAAFGSALASAVMLPNSKIGQGYWGLIDPIDLHDHDDQIHHHDHDDHFYYSYNAHNYFDNLNHLDFMIFF